MLKELVVDCGGSRRTLGIAVWACAEAPGMMWFTLSLLTLMPVFILYNRTRSKWNALIHPLLVTIRFARLCC